MSDTKVFIVNPKKTSKGHVGYCIRTISSKYAKSLYLADSMVQLEYLAQGQELPDFDEIEVIEI